MNTNEAVPPCPFPSSPSSSSDTSETAAEELMMVVVPPPTAEELAAAIEYAGLKELDYESLGEMKEKDIPTFFTPILFTALPTLESYGRKEGALRQSTQHLALAAGLLRALAIEGCAAPNLKYIHLADKSWGRPRIKLQKLFRAFQQGKCPQLETLQLTQVDFRGKVLEGLISALQEGKLPALKTLHLSEVYCDEHTLERLAAILTQLETKRDAVVHLDLSSRRTFDEEKVKTSFGIDGFEALAEALQSGAGYMVRSVHIQLATLSDEETHVLCDGLRACRHLVSLGFTRCEFLGEVSDSESIDLLVNLLSESEDHLTELESFTLLKNQYTIEMFEDLIEALSDHSQLKNLVLTHVEVDVENLLTALKKKGDERWCPGLESLTLGAEDLWREDKKKCLKGFKKYRPEVKVSYVHQCVDEGSGDEDDFTEAENDGFKYGEGGDADYVDGAQGWFM